MTKDDLELLILLSQLFKSWDDRDVLAQPGLQSARILLMGASSAPSGSKKYLQASAEFKTTQFHRRAAMAGNRAPGQSHTQDFLIMTMLMGYHIGAEGQKCVCELTVLHNELNWHLKTVSKEYSDFLKMPPDPQDLAFLHLSHIERNEKRNRRGHLHTCIHCSIPHNN